MSGKCSCETALDFRSNTSNRDSSRAGAGCCATSSSGRSKSKSEGSIGGDVLHVPYYVSAGFSEPSGHRPILRRSNMTKTRGSPRVDLFCECKIVEQYGERRLEGGPEVI